MFRNLDELVTAVDNIDSTMAECYYGREFSPHVEFHCGYLASSLYGNNNPTAAKAYTFVGGRQRKLTLS